MQADLGSSSEQIDPAVGLSAVAAPLRRSPYFCQALLATAPMFLIARAWLPGLDQPIIHDPLVHVLVTIVASILGVILALRVLHVARRAGDGRVFLIGIGVPEHGQHLHHPLDLDSECAHEKFGRFSAEQPTRQDSTGLGLTFCRLVVEAHGGTIGVTSVVVQGTTFRISLPATETC